MSAQPGPADTTEAAAALREYLSRPDVPCQYVEIYDSLAAAARRTEQAETKCQQNACDWADMKDARDAALARVRDLEQALANLVAAVDPLMESKPDEIMSDGRLRYDWTKPLYAIQQAICPARAALVSGAAEGNSDE